MSQISTAGTYVPPGAGALARVRARIDAIGRNQPARLALVVFAIVIAAVTGLLSLPAATASGERAPFADALFTATSAVCVTGLVTVDTATYWSGFGQVVILVAIKVGGLGVITIAALLGLAVSRRLGLTGKLLAARETKAERLGEVGTLLKVVIGTSLVLEGILTVVLFPRFLVLEETVGQAAWHALFYAISAFNNAGFVSHPGGLPGDAVGDWWLCVPLAVGVLVGSVGFPVLVAVGRSWRRPRQWGLHAQLTVTTTLLVLLASILVFGAFEWTNSGTFGPLDLDEKILATLFMAVMPRSGGFSTVDVGALHGETLLATDMLMFVGGGSASTAGGIKVTTLAVLFLAVVAEARGDSDVEAFGRRIPAATMRLSVTVLLVGSTLVAVSTMALQAITGRELDTVLFEVISAFATCGLSTGLTADLPDSGKYLLTALMFLGRTGTMSLAAALALRESPKMFRLAEERPIVG
ncbi:potassium transporter TrkG [Angustibacter speluncae]